MKCLGAVLLTVGMLNAQVAGGRAAGGVTFANSSGYGNVAFPGTGRPSFATSLGATVAGRPVPLRNGVGGRRNGVGSVGIGGLGYGYPSYIGGYDSSYYDQSGYGSQAAQPNVTIINNPPPPALAPTVVINQYMGAPPDPGSTETTHIFQPPNRYPAQAATDDSTTAPPHYFLIAFKDHSVYSALAYWIEDKTMHYVTPQQTHNQASLDLIDMDFTKKLNQQ